MKYFCIISLFIFTQFSLYSDHLDSIFNSNKKSFKIEYENRAVDINFIYTAYILNENYILYMDRNNHKLILRHLIDNKDTILLQDYKSERRPSIFFHSSQDKCVYTFRREDLKKIGETLIQKRFIIYLNNMYIEEWNPVNYTKEEISSLNRLNIFYWKADLKFNQGHKDFKNDYIEINASRSGNTVQIYYPLYPAEMGEKIIDQFSEYDFLGDGLDRSILISGFHYGFYTKSVYSDKENEIYQMALLAVDNKQKIQKVNIKKFTKDDVFIITYLENSSMDQEYLIMFGKDYKRNKYKDIINFMVLVRKKDLAIRYFYLNQSNLKNIEMKSGAYVVKDNKIIIANSQYNKSFISLVLE